MSTVSPTTPASDDARPYWTALTEDFGAAWNRFWFTARDPAAVSGLRILVGILLLYYLASHSADLVKWFGPNGLLPTSTVRQLTSPVMADGSVGETYLWSYLHWARTPGQLWGLHLAGLAVALLFTLGVGTRIMNPLAALVALSYIHRAPMINGPFESVLSMLLLYLCLAPSGAMWSVDAWRRRRANPEAEVGPSVMANISLRLLQIHVAGFYLLMGLTQLAGAADAENSATWWRGEALWWLIAKSESRVIDLTFLSTTALGYIVNLWTHLILFGELAFGILIWKPLARPLLLVLATMAWLSLAPVSGLVSYSVAMMIANLAFLPESMWRRAAGRLGLPC